MNSCYHEVVYEITAAILDLLWWRDTICGLKYGKHSVLNFLLEALGLESIWRIFSASLEVCVLLPLFYAK